MTDCLQALWQTPQSGAAFTDASDIERQSATVERRVRRRNLWEWIAGGATIAVTSIAAVGLLVSHRDGLAGACLLIAIGMAVVLFNMTRRASVADRRPEEDCLKHYDRQLDRQVRALCSAPLWYVAPLVPGLLLFDIALAGPITTNNGLSAAIAIAAPSITITIVILSYIAWLNVRAAKKIQRRRDELWRERAEDRI